MSDYTPTTADVRHAYVSARSEEEFAASYLSQFEPEFDRWLAAHDAEVAAQALGDAADKIHVSLQQAHKRARHTLDPMFSQHDQGLWDGYKNAENWLRDRAYRIERGE